MNRVLLSLGLIAVIACGAGPQAEEGTESESTRPVAHYLVLNKLGSSVGFHTSEGEQVTTIPVGKKSADESTVIYCLVHDHQVGFADVASGRQVASVDVEGAPVSLQMSPDGMRALTALQGEDSVYVISVEDRKIIRQFTTSKGLGPDPVLEIQP